MAAFATEHADGLIAELQPSADAVDQRLLEVAREAQAALSERTGVYGRVNRILGYADGRNPAVEIPVWDTAPLQRAVETFGQALPPVVPQQPSKFSGRTVTPYDDPDPEIREQARTAA